MGNTFFINVYLIIFNTVPLMQSMRSSHRLYLFIIIFYLFLIAHWLNTGKSVVLKNIWTLVLIFTLLFSGTKSLRERFSADFLPNDYFQAHIFLKNLNAPILYLPGYLPLHTSMLTTYSWATNGSNIQSIYLNPFSTYLPFNGLISYEQHYYPEHGLDPIMEMSTHDFYLHLKEKNISYVIYDNYFDWSNFPEFKLDHQTFELYKSFGQIKLFKVN